MKSIPGSIRSKLKKHPELLEPEMKLSQKEAERLVKAEEPRTFEEMVTVLKSREELPAEAWIPADRVIEHKKLKEKKRQQFAAALKASLAAAALVIAVLSALRFLPEAGSVRAGDVHHIAEVKNGWFTVRDYASLFGVPEGRDLTDGRVPETDEYESLHYTDPFAVAERIGKNIAYIDDENYRIVDIELNDEPSWLCVTTTYEDKNGRELLLNQEWSICICLGIPMSDNVRVRTKPVGQYQYYFARYGGLSRGVLIDDEAEITVTIDYIGRYVGMNKLLSLLSWTDGQM